MNETDTTTSPETWTGVDMIYLERRRQITDEGYSPEHDDQHARGEIAKAAACYAEAAAFISQHGRLAAGKRYTSKERWPWSEDSLKLSDDPIGNLVKAGALIAAEIDRLVRLRQKVKEVPIATDS